MYFANKNLDKFAVMILETERLDLIPLTIEDFEFFHAVNTNASVRKYLWDGEIITDMVSNELLQEVEIQFTKHHWGLWKIMVKDIDHPIGYVGLWHFFGQKQPQLLYVLLPEYEGKGYATEASRRIIDYAFDELNFEYLVASLDKPHRQSRSVCERLEMRLIGEKVMDDKPTLFYKIDRE